MLWTCPIAWVTVKAEGTTKCWERAPLLVCGLATPCAGVGASHAPGGGCAGVGASHAPGVGAVLVGASHAPCAGGS